MACSGCGNGMALSSVIGQIPLHVISVGTGAPAGQLFHCLARRSIRILDTTEEKTVWWWLGKKTGFFYDPVCTHCIAGRRGWRRGRWGWRRWWRWGRRWGGGVGGRFTPRRWRKDHNLFMQVVVTLVQLLRLHQEGDVISCTDTEECGNKSEKYNILALDTRTTCIQIL